MGVSLDSRGGPRGYPAASPGRSSSGRRGSDSMPLAQAPVLSAPAHVRHGSVPRDAYVRVRLIHWERKNMYLAQSVSHNKNRLPSGDDGRLEGEEPLREATLRSGNGQARFREVETSGLVGVEGSYGDAGRRWQMRQRVERLQRASDPEPRTLGCILGAS